MDIDTDMVMGKRRNKSEEGWTLIIKPQKKWYDIDLRGIWRYRDLCYMYIRRDIVTRYKQTILGPLWFFVEPMLTTIIYMFVFGGLAGISTDGVPQPLFYMSGILLWNYFNSVFIQISNVFTSNIYVFEKVYFPRMVIPLSVIFSYMIRLGIQLFLFILIYIYFYVQGAAIQMNWTVCLFPVLVIMTAFFAMAGGLIISALTTKYRDLMILVQFGIQLFMYTIPVVYPLSAIPEKYRAIIAYNPLTPVFETLRYGFMGCGAINWGSLAYSGVFLIVMMYFALIIFNKVERNFVDTI